VSSRWAVGSYDAHKVSRSLILRRSGSTWKQVKSPNPGGGYGTFLTGVSGNWAVGGFGTPSPGGAGRHSLILHWNGSRWKRVPGPNPGSLYTFVFAVSGRWAVGGYSSGRPHSLVLRLGHGRWRRVPSASPGRNGDTLRAVSAGWAVGVKSVAADALDRTLTLHRTASGWRAVASPNPGGVCSLGCDNELNGVSGGWAVGRYTDATFAASAMLLHFVNGRWRTVTLADAASVSLNGISGEWAVGAKGGAPLILRRAGGTWAPV